MGRVYIRKDRSGEKFGRLLILHDQEDIVKDGLKIRVVKVRCDCGTEYSSRLSALTNGSVKSCGCLQKEIASKTCIDRNTTHNDSKSKEYAAWKQMLTRCKNASRDTYDNYGGRGIKVDATWEKSYETFLKDLGRSPDCTRDWSVGRKDNNGDYCPSNCQWELIEQQARNRGMQHNNTTGMGGVYPMKHKGILHYVANWYDFQLKKRKTRVFSTRKYGETVALALAKECRKSAIEEMNARGAGYSEQHGKPREVKETAWNN